MKARTLVMLMLCLGACKTGKVAEGTANNAAPSAINTRPQPHLLVYKTRGDYKNLVPVILSDDKKKIISYPSSGDLKNDKGFIYPTILENGYLLDNRGINLNIAFLSLTYEAYAKLAASPSLDELYNMIIDKDPLTELCDCGVRTKMKDVPATLNTLINNKQLRTTCKVIK